MWSYRGERYNPASFTETMSYGGGSVMIWCGICVGAHTDLVAVENGSLTALRYFSDILEPHVMPFAPFIGDDLIFMHDNARPHLVCVVRDYLSKVSITQMDWPTRSSDMDPIEHVRVIIGRRVSSKNSTPRTVEELKLVLAEECENLPQEMIDGIIGSMGEHIHAFIRVRESHTRFLLFFIIRKNFFRNHKPF